MKKIIIAGVVFLVFQIFLVLFLLGLRFYLNNNQSKLEAGIVVSQQPKTAKHKIVAAMSLEQKVGQLIHTGMSGKSAKPGSKIIQIIKKYHIGGVIQFAKNYGSAKEIYQLNESLQKAAMQNGGIPLYISSDQEGGRVYRVGPDGATQFPGAMAIGQSGDDRMAKEIGFVTGYELRQLGIDLIFAPVMDINNNPENPVIQTRSFGSSANRVSNMANAFMIGMMESKSTPVIKHFPGHGDTHVDSHLSLPIVKKSRVELSQMELLPFQKAIDSGAEAVMSAHILFPALDQNNPATLSPIILKDLLKKKMGFEGLSISDAMEMKAIADRYGQGEATVKAFAAGIDIILLISEGETVQKSFDALVSAFRSGRLDKNDLDIAVIRQIELKEKKMLFHRWDDWSAHPDPDRLKQWQADEGLLQSRYKQINDKYLAKNSSLNQEISRKSIKSLGKDFRLPTESKELVFYYKSKTLQREASRLGIESTNIKYLSNIRNLFNKIRHADKDTVIAIEIYPAELKHFNTLVKSLNAKGENAPTLIGLYAYNPFEEIRVPARGAVLASFSPTSESRKALAYHLVANQTIQQADLILNLIQ